MLYSMTTAAALIASVTGAPVDQIHAQFRGLQQRGNLLHATRGERESYLFDLAEVVVARLLIAGIENGLQGSDLNLLASEIRNGRRAVFPSTGDYSIDLESNLPRIADGETWHLECARSRDPETSETRFNALWVRREPDGRINRFGPHHHDPSAPGAMTVDGAPIEGVLTIDASALLRPIIDAAQG